MSIDRFPLISFQLQVGEFIPYELFFDEGGRWNGRRGDELLFSEKPQPLLGDLCLEEMDVLYVVGLKEEFAELKKWLKGGKRRQLIFWEEDLSVIDAFVRGPWAEEFLGCEQVHLHYAVDPEGWKHEIRDLACRFPFRNAEVIGGREEFRLEVLKMHMATGSHLGEALYGHKLLKHTLMNARHLMRSASINQWKGEFKGVPAVICGAGPSLSEDLEAIKELGDRALVIAGGSAITALTRAGIEPHLNLAIDPNGQEVRCLEGMKLKQAPFIYSYRLHPDVFSLVESPLGYLKTHAGRKFETWMECQLGIEGEPLALNEKAFSVTTLALSLAVELGCDPIILVGVDLAYTGGKRYPEGVMDGEKVSFETLKAQARLSEDQPVWKRGVHGEKVLTLVKWIVESESISEFATEHARTRFLNATSDGLGFSKISHIAMREAPLKREYPLRKKIEQLLQSSALEVTPEALAALMGSVAKSVKRSLTLCEQMLEELVGIDKASYVPTPKMALYESDLSEELIFEYLLEDLGCAIERLLGRSDESLTKKWKAYKEVLESISDAVLFELVAQRAHADA